MALTCPDCGAEVTPGAKFCPECGVRQPDRPAPSREVRKQVTILFADVTGSTALGERLDPEALRALMTRYFTVMRSIIERHGGTVEKFIGDAVMAVFGIPVVHEDDALRAVRAAAEIRDALAAMNAELEARRGIAIRFRTGVNTGEVVAGDPEAGTTLVTGDTVNTAARLEQAAPPGEILLGRLTWSLVRDAVDAEPVDAVQAKGKAEPVEAWRLVAVRAGAEGRARHLDAPMVGRDRELATLTGAWRRAVDERTPHLVTLVAPAGVGKSRLVREFIERVRDDGGRALVGRCLSYGEGITWWPVRELVHQAAGITEADDREAARRRIEALVGDSVDATRIAGRVSTAVGLSTDAVPQEEMFWAVRRLLEHLATQQPTLVVLEDLHWAEDTLLDLVEYVVDLAQDIPLLVLATARTELLERRPELAGARPTATVTRLEPLSGAAAEALIVVQAGGSAVPAGLRARILAASEGTPLYVEEFVGLLRDDGNLTLDPDGTWRATIGIDAIEVPFSVSALLAARLEGLPAGERLVAQHASVMGRTFEASALSQLDSTLSADLGRHLLALVRKDLLRPDRAELTAGDAFRFRHVLIRDAAYAALPKSERAELHERFADWLEAAAGDRVTELEPLIGYHLAQAHGYHVALGEAGGRVDRLAARAGEHLAAAGMRSYDLDDVGAARQLLEAAARLVRLDDLPWRLMVNSMHLSGDEVAARRMVEGSLAEGRDSLAARLTRIDFLFASFQALHDELVMIADEAVRTGQPAIAVRCMLLDATQQSGIGRMQLADDELQRVMGELLPWTSSRDRGQVTTIRADIIAEGPTPTDEAIPQLLAMRDATDSPVTEATISRALAWTLAVAGDIEAARASLERAIELRPEPLPWEVGMLLRTEQAIAQAAHDHAAGIDRAERSFKLDEAADDRNSMASSAADYARMLAMTGGDPADVRRLIDRSLEVALADDTDAAARRAWAIAALASSAGDWPAAWAAFSEGDRLLSATGYIAMHADLLFDDARLSMAVDPERARVKLASARGHYERKGHVFGIARCDALTAELGAST